MSYREGKPEVGAEAPNLVKQLIKGGYTFYDLIRKNRSYFLVLTCFFFVAGTVYPYPQLAMWVGFFFAAYSVIANDSIQTIGTFLASNSKRPWWLLWLFIGGLFVLTVGYSWHVYSGDVSYQRLASKGFAEAPTSFTFLQIAAPLFLLALTRLKIPVSTTFMILTCFAASAADVGDMMLKSLGGYVSAFIAAIIVWRLATGLMDRWFKTPAQAYWVPLQWCATAFLWYSWLSQDAANIAVYLPRSLDASQFIAFASIVFFGLGILFYLRGDKIQQVVTEKTEVIDVRAATLIDVIYGLILLVFKDISQIPMSTTWVFIGLLAGREFGIAIARRGLGSKTWRMMGKDLRNVTIGLIVSVLIAVASNPAVFFPSLSV